MTKTIENLLLYGASISDILILVLFLTFFKSTRILKSLWAIALYTLIALSINYLVTFPVNLKVFFTLFTFFEYLLFASFFYFVILSDTFKKIVIAGSICFTIFVWLHSFLSADYQVVDSVPIAVETIFILIYAFYFLYEQMNDIDGEIIYNKYSFWITTGIMLYLAGSFFIYLFSNQVEVAVLHEFWFLTHVFYILKNLFFGVAIFIHLKKIKSPHPRKLNPYLN